MPVGCRQPPLQRNTHARVRQTTAEIHRAINRIHHPTPFGTRIPDRAFLTENRNLRKRLAQIALDHPLTAFIQLQLDVMRRLLVDALVRPQLALEKQPNLARHFLGRRQSGIYIGCIHFLGRASRRIQPFDR